MPDTPAPAIDPMFVGKDNYGRPRQNYLDRLAAMTDEKLENETSQAIWLSAYASNNPRSDYHWHVSACAKECAKRSDKLIYKRAYKAATNS